MTVKELIERLGRYPPDMTVEVYSENMMCWVNELELGTFRGTLSIGPDEDAYMYGDEPPESGIDYSREPIFDTFDEPDLNKE